MTDNNTIDYAAIIRAAQEHLPDTPDWLALGKQIYSTERGSGEVKALLGKRLVVCFQNEDELTQISDWPLAIAQGRITSCNPTFDGDTSSTSALDVSLSEQLSAIPDPAFRAVAQELALNLTSIRSTEANTGTVYPLPEDLPSDLRSVLDRIGLSHLYSHQIEALDSLRSGLDLSICTQTASGKTLCYNVAILESCLNQPGTTSLYIFPLKALALDQMQKLSELVRSLPIKVALMTGDTPKDERQRLFIPSPPNILAVSPDLLHHYLYNVRRQDEGEPWQFLQQLRYIVIDESHTYTGAFGAHFANLMRRLRLAVDGVGGNSDKLQFICTSATIGNPEEMALRFSGRTEQPERLRLIQHSGARSAGRTILCLNPSSTANPDACKIILSWLQHDLSGIVFCNSRAAVKNLLGLIQRQTARQGMGHLAHKVAIFYGSLKSDRRREIIQQLKQGRLKVILATSALEAGIDLPELQCCLIRGFPGSLMSFWQRVGRAGRNQHGLVVFLPVAQNILDDFYGRNPEQLLSGEVESAAFNPQYPTILSKHLECGCVESGVPLASVTSRFGQAAGAIADSLLQQNKLYLSRNNQIWGKGYPHKNVSLRGSSQDAISLIDKESGEPFEEMSLALAQRELFPGAIYMAQDAEGELIAYRSESLDEERKTSMLAALGQDNDLFTQAESQLDIQLISKLAEPKIIPTAIPEARLRLTLAWGKITTLVTGYQQLVRAYVMTCTNGGCPNYRQSLEGQTCASCKCSLHSAEITKVVEEVQFEEPLQTQYQSPCVKVELNPPLVSAIHARLNEIKESVRTTHGNDIPDQFKHLWDCDPEFIALHSMVHQIIKAVPLVILSSSLDVDAVVNDIERRTVGYFFDTCDDGTGSAEAIFHQLSQFARKAKALAIACSCESGCPRCLTQHGCPQQNTGLHKDAGLFLLDVISQENQTDNFDDKRVKRE